MQNYHYAYIIILNYYLSRCCSSCIPKYYKNKREVFTAPDDDWTSTSVMSVRVDTSLRLARNLQGNKTLLLVTWSSVLESKYSQSTMASHQSSTEVSDRCLNIDPMEFRILVLLFHIYVSYCSQDWSLPNLFIMIVVLSYHICMIYEMYTLFTIPSSLDTKSVS